MINTKNQRAPSAARRGLFVRRARARRRRRRGPFVRRCGPFVRRRGLFVRRRDPFVTVWLLEDATLAGAIAKKLASVSITKRCGLFYRQFGAPLVKRAGDSDHWHVDEARTAAFQADEVRQARLHTCADATCSCAVSLRDAHSCSNAELCHGRCAFDVGISVDDKEPYLYSSCAGASTYAGTVVWYPALLYVEATLPALSDAERQRRGPANKKRVTKTMVLGNACYDLKAIIESNGCHFRTRFQTNLAQAWYLHDGTSEPTAQKGKRKGTPVLVSPPQWITRQGEGEYYMCGYLFRRRTKFDG